MSSPKTVLEVENLTKHFDVTRGLLRKVVAKVRAVDGVSFDIAAGETLCLVGESGCGKSTVAKLILRLIEPSSGKVALGGTDVTKLDEAGMRAHRRHVQMVFQDPYASLNPRLKRRHHRDGADRELRSHDRRPTATSAGGQAADARRFARRFAHASLPVRVLGRAAPTLGDRARPRAQSRRLSSPTSPYRRSTCRCRRRF